MSLTNYISQSIIGSLIFFPYALGLASTLGIAWSFVVGLGGDVCSNMVLPPVAQDA